MTFYTSKCNIHGFDKAAWQFILGQPYSCWMVDSMGSKHLWYLLQLAGLMCLMRSLLLCKTITASGVTIPISLFAHWVCSASPTLIKRLFLALSWSSACISSIAQPHPRVGDDKWEACLGLAVLLVRLIVSRAEYSLRSDGWKTYEICASEIYICLKIFLELGFQSLIMPKWHCKGFSDVNYKWTWWPALNIHL